LDWGYLTKQAKTDKSAAEYNVSKRPIWTATAMFDVNNFESARKLAREIFFTFCLVVVITALIQTFVWQAGMTRGTVTYLIPVLIAATRWGLVPALFAAFCGVVASAFLFFPPYYSLRIKDPQEVINLSLFIFVAVVVSQLATRLKRQLEMTRQREIDMRDLYAFSRRLAVAFDVREIHSAIEDHLAAVMKRKVVLFAGARDAANGSRRRAVTTVPESVRLEVIEVANGRRDPMASPMVTSETGENWLVRGVSPKNNEFGVIAINLGRGSKESTDELRVRVDAVLADATATLERLGVAHAISEACMRAQTDQLREAMIGSVSHELRTPLASILGAASVLSAAPALANEKKLRTLVQDVRDEAERLNNDIQNLLDATRISSDGINPHMEWADPADIVNSAIERCRQRFGERRITQNLARDVPMIHVDPVLIQQALVQIFDNAVKYSPPGSPITITGRARDGHMILSVSDEGAGLTPDEHDKIWERFARGVRHATTTSGSGLGLWIASSFIAANGGRVNAMSDGPGLGATVTIELPVKQAAAQQLESDTDE
jgi:two-component system sensor histidine kinase KdpD